MIGSLFPDDLDTTLGNMINGQYLLCCTANYCTNRPGLYVYLKSVNQLNDHHQFKTYDRNEQTHLTYTPERQHSHPVLMMNEYYNQWMGPQLLQDPHPSLHPTCSCWNGYGESGWNLC